MADSDEPVDDPVAAYWQAVANMHETFQQEARALNVPTDILKMRYERPAQFEQLRAWALQKRAAVEARQRVLDDRAKEAGKKLAELRSAAPEDDD